MHKGITHHFSLFLNSLLWFPFLQGQHFEPDVYVIGQRIPMRSISFWSLAFVYRNIKFPNARGDALWRKSPNWSVSNLCDELHFMINLNCICWARAWFYEHQDGHRGIEDQNTLELLCKHWRYWRWASKGKHSWSIEASTLNRNMERKHFTQGH